MKKNKRKGDKLTYILTAINTFLIVTFAIVVIISIVYRVSNPELTETQLAFWELKVFWPLILMWIGLGLLEFKLLQ